MPLLQDFPEEIALQDELTSQISLGQQMFPWDGRDVSESGSVNRYKKRKLEDWGMSRAEKKKWREMREMKQSEQDMENSDNDGEDTDESGGMSSSISSSSSSSINSNSSNIRSGIKVRQ